MDRSWFEKTLLLQTRNVSVTVKQLVDSTKRTFNQLINKTRTVTVKQLLDSTKRTFNQLLFQTKNVPVNVVKQLPTSTKRNFKLF